MRGLRDGCRRLRRRERRKAFSLSRVKMRVPQVRGLVFGVEVDVELGLDEDEAAEAEDILDKSEDSESEDWSSEELGADEWPMTSCFLGGGGGSGNGVFSTLSRASGFVSLSAIGTAYSCSVAGNSRTS